MKAKNVITAIFAAFFSVLLVTFCIFAVLSGTVAATVTKKGVVQIVQNIDYTALLPESEQIINTIDSSSLDKETAEFIKQIVSDEHSNFTEEIFKTKMAKELIGAYAEDIIGTLKGTASDMPSFSKEAVEKIINDNKDEIVKFAKPYMDESVTEEELAAQINTVLNNNVHTIVEAIPTVTEIEIPVTKEISSIFKTIFGPYVTLILAGLTLIVAATIFVLRLQNLNGLLWLGIDFGIVTFITAALALTTKTISKVLSNVLSSAKIIADAVITVAAKQLLISALICLLFTIVFIVLFILLKKNKSNKTEVLKTV